MKCSLAFVLAVLILVSKASSTLACPICVSFPASSIADHLLQADCVVLAREDPDQPYTYLAHELLHGRCDGVQIDLLLDTLTSKRLAADSDLSVILVRRESTWRSLGIASDSLEKVVRSILRHRPRWSTPEGDAHRVRFFMALFGSQEPTLYRLAYIELSRAPYGTIRRFARFVPREQILPMLEDRKFIEWRGLAILLLAGSHHDQDATRIRQALQATQQMHLTTNLAAWAAAAIEQDGEQAVEFLQKHYCENATRSSAELIEIHRALSLHARHGRTDLLPSIAGATSRLLETHPGMRNQIKVDMAHWQIAAD